VVKFTVDDLRGGDLSRLPPNISVFGLFEGEVKEASPTGFGRDILVSGDSDYSFIGFFKEGNRIAF